MDLSGVLPDTLATQQTVQISSATIFVGKDQVPLGDVFSISGDCCRDLTVRIENATQQMQHLGAGLRAGHLEVFGNVGSHAGAQMTGGRLTIRGNAGHWLGAELRGGRIDLSGDAGDHVGGAYSGSRRGMNGGLILIRGSAGSYLADHLRRGLIAVGGSTGAYPACQLVAGSVFLFGPCGSRPAAGMRRGTLVCFHPQPTLLPTFRRSCCYQPQFLLYYLRELSSFGFPVSVELLQACYTRYCGDLLESGKGEVLVRNC